MDYPDILLSGGIGVLATDTIYGVVGSALNQQTVERIYTVRKRHPDKPFIILIHDQSQLEQFGVQLLPAQSSYLSEVWPGPVSVILACSSPELAYLHRGTNGLAFRVPGKESLRSLLFTTGALVAPSANPEGEPPATTINQARDYFGESIDFYIDEGEVTGTPSRLVDLRGDDPVVLR